MPHADNSAGRKVITLVFVVAWSVVTIGLAVENIEVVQPPFYGVFTAIVFLIIGRQWDIEVERLLPTTSQLTNDTEEDDES